MVKRLPLFSDWSIFIIIHLYVAVTLLPEQIINFERVQSTKFAYDRHNDPNTILQRSSQGISNI